MSPKPSKAISPEITALFSRIEQQASEYEQAFEDLDTFLRKANRTNRQMEEIFAKNSELYDKSMELFNKFNALDDYISARINTITKELREYLELVIISDFNNKSADILNDFTAKSAEALGIMEGENGIAQFLEDIKVFQSNKDTKLNEINELIEKLKTQNEEIESSKKEYMKLVRYVNFKISDFEQKMDSKLDSQHQEYENKLADMVTNIEKKIKEEIYNYLKNKN